MSEPIGDNRLGSVIQGRYRVVSFLARGGAGAVYLCEDLRLVGQRWALKELLATGPEAVDNFRRETEILSRLRHEQLPTLVDSFCEDGSCYLVMEFVEGETLAARLERQGPASEREALRWTLQLARVLEFLHSQEKPIIFRDLKPENVMVTPSGGLKLVDFGLARVFETSKRHDTQLSGSVGYAAPEQWEDVRQSDERSDIYGLGATLYFMLTARPPSPVYGRQRLRLHCPQVDTTVEAIVNNCLQPKPALRYPHCGALSADIQRWLDRPEPRPSRLPRGRVLALALVMWLGGAVLWGLTRPAPPPPRLGISQLLQQTAEGKARARRAMQAGDRQAAVQILDELLERYPLDGDAQILLSNAQVTARATLRIPVLTSISGPEEEGIKLLNGLALAQLEVNRRGGVLDAGDPQAGRKPLILELLDCQSKQNVTVENAMTVASNPAYRLVLGPWTSQQFIAVAPILEKAGLPTLSPVASDPRVWTLGRHSFTAADSDRGRLRALAQHFLGEGLRRAVVVRNAENVVSNSDAAEFQEFFAAQGGTTLLDLSYGDTTLDFRPLVDEIARAKPDFVFVAEYRSAPILSLAQQTRARGLKLPIGTQCGLYTHAEVVRANRALDGVVTSTYFYPVAADERTQGFTRRFRSHYGGALPSHLEANSYDCLFLVAQAVEAVGWHRQGLTDYLRSLEIYRGVTGEFAPGRRLDRRQAYTLEINDGEFRQVGGPRS